MKSFMAKQEEVKRNWYVVDADGMALGRLASQVASILRGKNKPEFTPHVDTGDFVIVINTDKVVLTGDKLNQKLFRRHSGKPGNLKEIKYGNLMQTRSDFVVYRAVKGMLPKNSLGAKMLTKLRVYKGAEHEQQAQKPIAIDLKD
ncbi:MAG: 50S ribosomal protein L13 [Clostridiales bacterium]|nr:50S ribosomal protein L13 [Clostridiales bacterium]MDD6054694.1 50S ribosomal protein L13 [Clostridiales bacterium]MDD7506789.1 50S ribosomal protein L13 [Clostridiales bacterium]MDY5677998.1 50S ribosomal protein L13 [Eubacteriales bacterium]MDY5726097.1 50S ribosomal protein L13 [Eubacteriales bacterium]